MVLKYKIAGTGIRGIHANCNLMMGDSRHLLDTGKIVFHLLLLAILWFFGLCLNIYFNILWLVAEIKSQAASCLLYFMNFS